MKSAGPGVVGVDAADLRGREEHELAAARVAKKSCTCRVIREVELLPRVRRSRCAQPPASSRRTIADPTMPAVAGDEDARGAQPREFPAFTHGG